MLRLCISFYWGRKSNTVYICTYEHIFTAIWCMSLSIWWVLSIFWGKNVVLTKHIYHKHRPTVFVKRLEYTSTIYREIIHRYSFPRQNFKRMKIMRVTKFVCKDLTHSNQTLLLFVSPQRNTHFIHTSMKQKGKGYQSIVWDRNHDTGQENQILVAHYGWPLTKTATLRLDYDLEKLTQSLS